MLKPFFTIFLVLLFFAAVAQKKSDTLVYYLKNSGLVVSSKDSADFFLVIMPPDTTVDKKLFVVKEFYPNGRLRLAGNSTTNTLNNLKFQGSQISFFPNGHKMGLRNFENGVPVGDILEYYPNGKLFNVKTFTSDKRLLLEELRDSTGILLTQKGKGKWIKYFNGNFDNYSISGAVNKGLEDGQWSGKRSDSVNVVWIYKNGQIISAKDFDLTGKDITYLSIESQPEFPGGSEKMDAFIKRNIQYPETAIKNGTKGVVVVRFIVEADGTLTNFQITKGIGDGCDEEALRVLKILPKWMHGMRKGKPVPLPYSVPISFGLEK